MSISGKFMTASLNGTAIFNNYAWTATGDVKDLDRTVGADNGFRNHDGGVQGLKVDIKGYMDIANGVFANIVEGTVLSSLNLFRDENDVLPAYSMSESLVLTANQGGEVDGKIEFSISVVSKGQYFYNDPS